MLADTEFLARLIEFPGNHQTNSKTQAADERHLFKIQKQRTSPLL